MDCSLPGSSVHGIFQARALELGAIAFSIEQGAIHLILFSSDSDSWNINISVLFIVQTEFVLMNDPAFWDHLPNKYLSLYIYYNGEGNGTPLQYFCLENLMDRGAW